MLLLFIAWLKLVSEHAASDTAWLAAGIPTQGYQLVYEPIFAALESDSTILQTLMRLQNQTGLLSNLVNGVDTVVDSKGPCRELPEMLPVNGFSCFTHAKHLTPCSMHALTSMHVCTVCQAALFAWIHFAPYKLSL